MSTPNNLTVADSARLQSDTLADRAIMPNLPDIYIRNMPLAQVNKALAAIKFDTNDDHLATLFSRHPRPAQQQLDAAVAATYGWTDFTATMPHEEILKRMLALNMARV